MAKYLLNALVPLLLLQEVEYVKQEAKVVYLLECLQKTSPPVRSIVSLFN